MIGSSVGKTGSSARAKACLFVCPQNREKPVPPRNHGVLFLETGTLRTLNKVKRLLSPPLKKQYPKLGKCLDKLKKKPVLAKRENFSSDPCACDMKIRFTNKTSDDPSLFSSSSLTYQLLTLHLSPLPPLTPGGQQTSDA